MNNKKWIFLFLFAVSVLLLGCHNPEKNEDYQQKEAVTSEEKTEESTEQKIDPEHVYTWKESLPEDVNVDRLSVAIAGYPEEKTYTIYRQGGINESTLFPGYISSHGCAACCLATVLTASEGEEITPAEVVESIEKDVFGEERHTKNYSKTLPKQMPICLNGISKILDEYQVSHTYIRQFEAEEAEEDIMKHLYTGNPVIVTGSGGPGSYHTILFLGVTESGEIIVGDPAGGGRVYLSEPSMLFDLLFSCTDETADPCYFSGRKSAGGYIKVNIK